MKNFLFLVCLLSILSCKNNADKKEVIKKEITIGSYFKAVDYAPYLIAKEKGWFDEVFKKEKVKIKYETFEDLAVINDAFLKNKLDIVFEAEPPAIISEASKVGVDVMDISCSLEQEILVNKNSKINSFNDLKGKKIAVLSGTSSHYGVLNLLSKNGIKESEVIVLDMSPIDAKIAFEAGKIDAWAVWPPFVEQQEISGKGKVLPKGNVFIHSIMVVDEDFLNSQNDAFRKISRVFNDTKKWIMKNPDESIEIVAKSLDMDSEIVRKAWGKHNWTVKLNRNITQDIQNKARFLTEKKKINSELNVAKDLIKLAN